jgi:broad specificity phosphatase PhoE
LTATAPKGTSYKVLVFGRHGEGWHNVEEARVGGKLWDCYWSRRDGDGNITWNNAELTPLGVQQALAANAFWRNGLVEAKMPAPDSYYVSPLRRTLQTFNLTFAGSDLTKNANFKPTIKESLREYFGVHTSDRRATKSAIAQQWPVYGFEKDFSELDSLWTPDFRESGGENVLRMKQFLDDIFQNDNGTFISATSHAGSISSVLHAVGHRGFQLKTGTVIPVFLKAVRQSGSRPIGKVDPSERSPICSLPRRRSTFTYIA